MEFKSGDRLYCHTKCIMSGNDEVCTTIGWYYTIDHVDDADNEFCIYDDQDDRHYFRFKNYKKYFYHPNDIKELRKKKLNNILNSIK